MSDTSDLSSDTEYGSNGESEGPTQPKGRKIDDEHTKVSFKVKVQNMLTTLKHAAPGIFAVSGGLTTAPTITIALKKSISIVSRTVYDATVVHFPLYGEDEAATMIKLFKQSAHSRGVANAFRNSWEIDSTGFEILNPAWNKFVQSELVPRITEDMLIDFSFTPSLYKMLLYPTGSFHRPHRDSENISGKFATLVVQLPSQYQGGQLIVRHDGKTVTSDLNSTNNSDTFDTYFASFYSDCEYEVLEVTKGYGVCLVYNLISHESVVATAPRQHSFEPVLVNLIKKWKFRGKLVYGLKHNYYDTELTFSNLKTTDKSVAKFLLHIAKDYALNVYLAIFNKKSSWLNVSNGTDFNSNDKDPPSSCKSYSLSKFVLADGTKIPIDNMTVKFDNEVIPEDCFKDISPYHKQWSSESVIGGVNTHSYRIAAIVFWPEHLHEKILSKCTTSFYLGM